MQEKSTRKKIGISQKLLFACVCVESLLVLFFSYIEIKLVIVVVVSQKYDFLNNTQYLVIFFQRK